MKRNLILLCLISFVLIAKAEKNPDSIITDIQKKYAKDRSVSYYNITYKSTNRSISLYGSTSSKEAKDSLLFAMKNIYSEVKDSIKLLPIAYEKPWGIINVSIASLRTEPDYAAEMMSQTLMGTPAKILDTIISWALVETPDHLITWINRGTITELSQEEYINWKKSKRGIIIVNSSVIKSDQNNYIANVVRGNILIILDTLKDQVKVKMPDGQIGWLLKNDIQDFDKYKEQTYGLDVDRAISFGKSLLGRPYLWGGLSPFGMDCSGFVRTVFQEQGLLLARNSSQQARYGTEVPVGDYKKYSPGDLLFFRSSPTKEGGVTHVGIYIGDGRVINCASRVKIDSFEPKDSLFNDNLTRRLIYVRHITGNETDWGITSFAKHPWY